MNSLGFIARIFNMTLTDIAKELGVVSQTVNDWVKQKRKIPKNRLEQLVELFDLPQEYFLKSEQDLNEVERLTIDLKYYQSINKLKEDDQYRYWSHQKEVDNISRKIEDKKLLLKIEMLFVGGGRLGDVDYNPHSVKNYLLFEELVNVLNTPDFNKDKIDNLVITLLGENQKRAFDIAERFKGRN